MDMDRPIAEVFWMDWFTPQQSNIAIENGPFMVDLPMKSDDFP